MTAAKHQMTPTPPPERDRPKAEVYREAIVDAWIEAGMDLDRAERMARFTISMGRAVALLEIFETFPDKVFVAALQRVTCPPKESQAAAAKRLCVSRGALQKAERDIRERMNQGGGGSSHLVA